jgi:hypothetical protein
MNFKTYFQAEKLMFGPSNRHSDTGFGYDCRFHCIGLEAVTKKGVVWLYCLDHETNIAMPLTRWVRADAQEVEPIPGFPQITSMTQNRNFDEALANAKKALAVIGTGALSPKEKR